MSFLYNVWQSFKRKIWLHILAFFMLIILFYISTSVVGYNDDINNFFDNCGYSKDFSDNIVVESDINKFDKGKDWDKFCVDNHLNEKGCSAQYKIDELGFGSIIAPQIVDALTLKVTGNYFSKNYVGDGKKLPYEIIVNSDYMDEYKIGKEYLLTAEIDDEKTSLESQEKIRVKVIGYLQQYSIRLSFLQFNGLFESNDTDFLMCSIPMQNIDTVIIMSEQDYEANTSLLDKIKKDKSSVKDLYDKAMATHISNISSNIIQIVIVYLTLIVTLLSFNLFKYDVTKKYNYIKKVVGENKLVNICTEVILNLIIFLLAICVVCILGAIDPYIFGGLFPNVGFGISVLVVAITYFGIQGVTLYKFNNCLN